MKWLERKDRSDRFHELKYWSGRKFGHKLEVYYAPESWHNKVAYYYFCVSGRHGINSHDLPGGKKWERVATCKMAEEWLGQQIAEERKIKRESKQSGKA